MAFPWAVLAAQGIGMLANRLFNQQVDPNKLFGAAEDKLALSDADLAQMRGQNLQNVQGLNARNLSEIQRMGAARRMPTGALASALAGSSYQAARGASGIEPQLRTAQIESLRPLEMMKAQLRMQNVGQNQQFWGQGLGDMAKVMLLWQAGLFGNNAGNNAGGSTTFGLQNPYAQYLK